MFPPVLSNSRVDEKLPLTVGANVTLTTTSAPGCSCEPTAGAPETEKGAAGISTFETVNGCEPLLAKPTVALDWVSGAIPPKLMPPVVEVRLGPASSPEPDRETVAVSDVPTVMVRPPPAGPAVVGVKVTGTVTDAPWARVSGRLGASTVNGPVGVSDVICTALFAVIVRGSVELWPITVVGKVGAGAVTGALTGAPNPSTCPSRVPTYRRLSATPGGLNLEDVPTGALHTSFITPPTGTGSYARS
jgi:hypothetical protein